MQPAVRNGDAVSVAGEIGEHRLGPGEGWFGVDEPVLPPQRREVSGEGLRISQAVEIAKERQPACRVGLDKAGQEEPPEQAGQHPDRQQKAGPTGDPACPVERDPAARHDHVDVRMVGHRRAPGVQHRGGADPGAEVLGIGGDGEQSLGRGAEQQVVDNRLVLVGDSAAISAGRVKTRWK